jgi:serine/threonine kinase 16
MSIPSQLLRALDSIKDQAKDALWALSSCICQQSAKVKINGRTCEWSYILLVYIAGWKLTELFIVNIIKVLGEGGFSFVYLAQDEHSGVSRAHI